MSLSVENLSAEDRALVLRALKAPRGRYLAVRAQQLSGVPARTLHDWATSDVLVPDWFKATPRGWSYRDIVFARLVAWLRSKHMDRAAAAHRVRQLRVLLKDEEIRPEVMSDGSIFLIGGEGVDRFSGQQAFDGLVELLDVFKLTAPIEGVTQSELWGPSLIRPSEHTFISPWVLAGDPCVRGSRVPTATLYALRTERGLDVDAIHRLYDALPAESIRDALALETRLRAA
jgi:uncharacterized protein (DUF433 family)